MSDVIILAARAIDAKCRTSDHFSMLTAIELLEEVIGTSNNGDKLISMLLYSESIDPSDYLDCLGKVESSIRGYD